MLETKSNVTGETVNPHSIALTPGGSSGGESALQALYGSPLGIGTDMGKSATYERLKSAPSLAITS